MFIYTPFLFDSCRLPTVLFVCVSSLLPLYLLLPPTESSSWCGMLVLCSRHSANHMRLLLYSDFVASIILYFSSFFVAVGLPSSPSLSLLLSLVYYHTCYQRHLSHVCNLIGRTFECNICLQTHNHVLFIRQNFLYFEFYLNH